MADSIKYQLLGPSSDQNADNLLKDCADNQEALQRMQALLSEWLRMENLVVLTAAGCSIDCGGKTMPSLEKSVLNAVKMITNLPAGAISIIEERLKDNNDEVEDLMSGTAKAAWAKTGFEQWLSYLVNSVYLAQETSSPVESLKWKESTSNVEDISQLISHISKAIYAECALTLPDDTASDGGEKKIAPHLAFLSKLVARDSNLGRTHLFMLVHF